MNCKLLLIGSILISTVLLSSESAAQNEWLKWGPESGVAIRQGNSVGWNQAVATREGGDNATAIVWEDTRNGCRSIAMQILEADGTPRFDARGILILETVGSHTLPSICPGPDESWLATWIDHTSYQQSQIRCSRISRNGELLWGGGEGGVEISVVGQHTNPQIFSDGADGGLVTWCRITGQESVICAMHIRADGSPDPDWEEGGLRFSSANARAGNPQVVSDGEGGAFLMWQESTPMRETVVAQHLGSGGELLWNNGQPTLLIETPTQNHHYELIADGAGGAIIAWTDMRNYQRNLRDVYVQRIDSEGRSLWRAGGSPIANTGDYEQNPRLVSSGVGEAIIVWEFLGAEADQIDIRAMKISGDDGLERLWNARNGVAVVTDRATQWEPRACSDGDGGAMIVWTDLRNGEAWNESDIYVQHLTSDGEAEFSESGLELYRGIPSQKDAVIVPVADSFITIWWEGQGSQCSGIKSQVIDAQGEPRNDPFDLVSSYGGSVERTKTISTGPDEFAVGWRDTRTGQIPPPLWLKTFRNQGGSVETLNEERCVLFIMPENTIPGPFDIAPAGNGGVIAVTVVDRVGSGQLLSQKIDRYGHYQWEGNLNAGYSIEVTTLTDNICDLIVTSDEEGGAFVGWLSFSEPNYDVKAYCQHISADGERLWGDEGILIGGRADFAYLDFRINSDGEGGAVVLWREVDLYSEPLYSELRANRINSDGEKNWGEAGISIMAGEFNCYDLQMINHPVGHFITWSHSYVDREWNEHFEIRTQMLSSNGDLMLDPGSVVLCGSPGYRGQIDVAVDSRGLIWVGWQDYRADNGRGPGRIYVQKLDPFDAAGGQRTVLFEEGGRAITEETHFQYDVQLSPDQGGGMWFVWSEWSENSSRDIRSIHLDEMAERYEGWNENGMTVCNEIFDQIMPQTVSLRNGQDGIATVFIDGRSSLDQEGGWIFNVYSQRIDDGSGLRVKSVKETTPTGFEITGIYPNPFNGIARLEYRIGNLTPVEVRVFDLSGRQVFGVESRKQSTGIQSLMLNAANWSSGEYIAKVKTGNEELSKRIVLVK